MENTTEVSQDAEKRVGINCFINEFSAIQFTYKYRYTDFVVHEIGKDKQPVRFVAEDLEGKKA